MAALLRLSSKTERDACPPTWRSRRLLQGDIGAHAQTSEDEYIIPFHLSVSSNPTMSYHALHERVQLTTAAASTTPYSCVLVTGASAQRSTVVGVSKRAWRSL